MTTLDGGASTAFDVWPILAFILIILVMLELLRRVVLKMDRFITGILRRPIPKDKRDPARAFTATSKREAAELAGGRCEGTRLIRCRHRGDDLHGDHWYPHSRGGATTPANLVMLCPKCNRRKSDKIPTSAETTVLYLRRRSYMPPDRMRPGQWRPRRTGPEPSPARIIPSDDF